MATYSTAQTDKLYGLLPAVIRERDSAEGEPLRRTEVRLRVRPTYTDLRYGQPAYLQLALTGPGEIATGAEDGSEMGAYCHLKQPQREANLRQRLAEYVPFGLDYGLVYET